MNAITFDTHAFVKDLTAAGFSEAQAEAVTELVRRAREFDLSELATKSDFMLLRGDVAHLATKSELVEAKADILKWMIGAMGFQTLVIIAATAALARLIH